jgi:diacylglycerol kinase (ATP)
MSEENKKDSSNSGLIASFDYALKGLVYAVKTQRNMRIHMIIAMMVIIISLFLNLSRVELIILVITISLVLITELMNTASELMVNLITEEHHPLAKIIKDMTAGAVLFSSISAVIVGYLIFIKKEILDIFIGSTVIHKIVVFPPYATALIILLVLVVTLFIKGVRQKSLSLEGGMPSIHTAVAFSLAVITYFLSSSFYVLLASLLLAAMVAQARLSSNIHNLWEVVVGAFLGAAITVFIFQIVI